LLRPEQKVYPFTTVEPHMIKISRAAATSWRT
jgi:hypothetical protein